MSDTFTYTQVRRVDPRGGSIVGGTNVTITGFGFDFATGVVTFGGTAATNVAIVSNTQMTATVPAHVSGTVDVVVAGVGTLTNGYTYTKNLIKLPPVPVASPVVQGGIRGGSASGQSPMELSNQKWLMEVKRVLENDVVNLPTAADDIVGTFEVDQIPELPWDHISKDGSSLADLEMRSATDLASGILAQAYGGTGRPYAYSFAPGSFTVPTGTFALVVQSLRLAGNQSVTVQGDGILAVI